MSSISKALHFVRGAVSKKDSNLEMKHFAIDNGQIRATNGVLTLGSPIDIDIKCAPKAAQLYNAIGMCNDVVSLRLTDTNRLSVVSGKFRALIPCVDMEAIPHPKPTGMQIEMDGEALLTALEACEPFVGTDDLRAWTNGILLKGQSAYATNNTIIVEHWIGVEMPTVNIPKQAVAEILRIGVAPSIVLFDGHSMSFIYDDNRWIKTQLLEDKWPPLSPLLDVESNPSDISPDIFAGLKAVRKFDNDRFVEFRDGRIYAVAGPLSDEEVSYEVDGCPPNGKYSAAGLAMLEGVADKADFTRYPEALTFFGKGLRGVMAAYNV